MGIPRFLSRYVGQIKNVYVDIGTGTQDVAAIWYDFNSVIHETRGEAYGESDFLSLGEREKRQKEAKENPAKAHAFHLKLIRETLDYILETFKPKNLLFLAIDGTSVLAKINQQRRRRYISAKTAKGEQILSSNAITPGTEFMFNLDRELKEILASLKAKHDISLVLYSSHLVPSEGENKILDNMRSGKYNFIGKHVCCGLDADLVPLGMSLNRDDIYMYQGKDRFGKWYGNIISIAKVRDHMLTQAGFLDDTGRPRFKFNGQNVVTDIVSLFAFLSNDFLPSFPGFSQQIFATDEVLAAYSRYMKTSIYTKDASPDLQYITDKSGVIMRTMILYLAELSKAEVPMIRLQRLNPEYLPSEIINESTTVENEESDRPKVIVDIKKFKTLWWKQFDYVDIPEDYNFSQVDKDYKEFVYQKYFEGIQWFFKYYIGGYTHVNLNWVYPFNWAPMLSDLLTYTYIESDDWSRREASLTPLLAMLIILPPKSFNLIPPQIVKIVERGPLCDTAPIDFDIITAGLFQDPDSRKKKKIPEGTIPLIPPVVPYRVIYEVSKMELEISLLKRYQAKKQEEITGSKGVDRALRREFERMSITGPTERGRPRGRGRGESRGRGDGGRGRGTERKSAPRGRGEGRPSGPTIGRPRGSTSRVPRE